MGTGGSGWGQGDGGDIEWEGGGGKEGGGEKRGEEANEKHVSERKELQCKSGNKVCRS